MVLAWLVLALWVLGPLALPVAALWIRRRIRRTAPPVPLSQPEPVPWLDDGRREW